MPKASEAALRLSTGARELLGLCERWFMLGLGFGHENVQQDYETLFGRFLEHDPLNP